MITVDGQEISETLYEWRIKFPDDRPPIRMDYQDYDELEARQMADLESGKLIRAQFGLLHEEEVC